MTKSDQLKNTEDYWGYWADISDVPKYPWIWDDLRKNYEEQETFIPRAAWED